MARFRVFLIVGAVVIIVGAGLWFWLRPKPVAVKYVVLKRADMIVSVFPTTTSTIRSDNEVTISAQRNGRVTHLPFEEGDSVAKGQIVGRLDLSEETARVFAERDQARAALTEAERTFARLAVFAIFNTTLPKGFAAIRLSTTAFAELPNTSLRFVSSVNNETP